MHFTNKTKALLAIGTCTTTLILCKKLYDLDTGTSTDTIIDLLHNDQVNVADIYCNTVIGREIIEYLNQKSVLPHNFSSYIYFHLHYFDLNRMTYQLLAQFFDHRLYDITYTPPYYTEFLFAHYDYVEFVNNYGSYLPWIQICKAPFDNSLFCQIIIEAQIMVPEYYHNEVLVLEAVKRDPGYVVWFRNPSLVTKKVVSIMINHNLRLSFGILRHLFEINSGNRLRVLSSKVMAKFIEADSKCVVYEKVEIDSV